MEHRYLKTLLTLLILSYSQSFSATACNTPFDHKNAEYWQYNLDEAYQFGLKIQSLIKDKNSEGLMELIHGELTHGPRKKHIKSLPFDNIFPEIWQKTILQSNPPCSPIGWRGFTLGSGLIWYNKIGDHWEIFSINNVNDEKLSPYFGWKVDEHVLYPRCFIRNRLKNDDLNDIMDAYGIKKTFKSKPGLFYGKEINDFKPITSKFCQSCQKIDVIKKVEKCTKPNLEIINMNGSLKTTEKDIDGFIQNTAYKIIKKLEPTLCEKLAPNLNTPCHSCFFIEVGEDSGGTMGWVNTYGVYGIFSSAVDGKIIIPLKYFKSRNEGLNALDKLFISLKP